MLNKISSLMKLDKPLVIFDLETTGLRLYHDRILQIAFFKIMPNGRSFKESFLLNPEIVISAEASEVHGITNEMVAGKPTFKDKARELFDIFADCYYSGFNVIGFDLPLLRREFLRVGLDFQYQENQIIDTKVVYHYMEPRTLSSAYKYYCDKEHTNAHDAMSDVEVATEILVSQLDKYGYDFIREIHSELEDRHVDHEKKFYWKDGEAYFNFGSHKDESLSDVATKFPDFLQWMLKADFSEMVKNIVREALAGHFPKKAKK